MYNWRDTIVSATCTIRETIEVIDKSSLQVALVVGEGGRLLGIVTDGDIRRAFLRNIDTGAPVVQIMNAKPTTADLGTTKEEIIALMKRKRLHHIPVVDSQGILLRLDVLDDLLDAVYKDNWVVVMAGGMGTRLAPLTHDRPKPMLHVGNKPILEIILENFIQQGFSQFFFSVNYKSEVIREYFGSGHKWGVAIEYLAEEKKLGTAGALSLLPDKPASPCIVMNGDLLTKVNFQSLIDFHTEQDSMATMCVREYDFQVPYGVINVENYRIREIVEKPLHKFFVNAGIYCLNPQCYTYIPQNEYFDMPSLFEQLIAEGRSACSFPIREYWLDIGRMSDFERANNEFPEVFIDR